MKAFSIVNKQYVGDEKIEVSGRNDRHRVPHVQRLPVRGVHALSVVSPLA